MIKLGFIGCGKMANYHAEVLKTLDAKIVSVCGRENSQRAKEFAQKHNVPKVYENWNKLIQNSEADSLDSLWITTSHNSTGDVIIPSIKTNLPLFVEKPVALNSKKIEEAIEVQKQTKNKVAIGMNRRFYDFIPELKEIIKNNELKSVEITLPEQLNDKNLKEEEEQNTVWFTNSIHELDLIYHLLGPLNVLYSHKYKTSKTVSYICLLESKGIPIQLNACWNSPWNKLIRFFFEKQVVELSPIECLKIFNSVEKIAPSEKYKIAKFQPKLSKEIICTGEFKPGLYYQDKTFIAYLKENNRSALCSLEDALEVSMLIEKIIK